MSLQYLATSTYHCAMCSDNWYYTKLAVLWDVAWHYLLSRLTAKVKELCFVIIVSFGEVKDIRLVKFFGYPLKSFCNRMKQFHLTLTSIILHKYTTITKRQDRQSCSYTNGSGGTGIHSSVGQAPQLDFAVFIDFALSPQMGAGGGSHPGASFKAVSWLQQYCSTYLRWIWLVTLVWRNYAELLFANTTNYANTVN